MTNPDFWKDRAAAREKAELLAEFKRGIEEYEKFDKELGAVSQLLDMASGEKDLAEVANSVSSFEKRFEKYETIKKFSGPYDGGNAVLSLFAGAGGAVGGSEWTAVSFLFQFDGERDGGGDFFCIVWCVDDARATLATFLSIPDVNGRCAEVADLDDPSR